MSIQLNTALKDTQSLVDTRNVRIDGVGIKDIKYPITIQTGSGLMQTAATLSMTVSLPANVKGTHMSRFVELLEEQEEVLDQNRFHSLVQEMLARLGADSGSVEMSFPYFTRKSAPVSGIKSLLDHEVCWTGDISSEGVYSFSAQVKVPVTSLCPCSKSISKYGAHNQRSQISIKARLGGHMDMDELISIAESSSSCGVYGLLKRVDEKYVTERAYENPKFVEDLVRDLAIALDDDPRILGYIVEVENYESIHNHSAFAKIVRIQ
jgi:GTP cyclohydrolase I